MTHHWLAFRALAVFGVAGECAFWVTSLERRINDALANRPYRYGESEAIANHLALSHRQQHYELGGMLMPVLRFTWSPSRRTLFPTVHWAESLDYDLLAEAKLARRVDELMDHLEQLPRDLYTVAALMITAVTMTVQAHQKIVGTPEGELAGVVGRLFTREIERVLRFVKEGE